jgi:L-asparaginase
LQAMLSKISKKIVVLGTGGTIAGTAAAAQDNVGYVAAQVDVGQLLAAIPGLTQLPCAFEYEQVAQLDSKDMSFAVLQTLATRVSHFLALPDVQGIVITHGTDTLEETAYFLHAVLPPGHIEHKPVVLTCAMRPATAMAPDGPQNVLDAFAVALTDGAAGVVVACAGALHSAVAVQKVHPYRLDAFSSGDTGPLGFIEEGFVRLTRNWHFSHVGIQEFATLNIAYVKQWPRVEIVMNHAGANGAMVDALLDQAAAGHADPVRGIVVAATGNGTVHHALEAALLRAQAGGVKVVRASRCPEGRMLPVTGNRLPDSNGLSPVKARIALMLSLLDRPG